MDSGFRALDPPTEGKYIVLRRTNNSILGVPGNPNSDLEIMEMRLYQTPNLLMKLSGKVTVTGPDPEQSIFAATNLITNLEDRTASSFSNTSSDTPPYIRPISKRGSNYHDFYSCYRVSSATLAAKNHILELKFDLGDSYFQHAILIVGDTGRENPEDGEQIKDYLVRNFEIYVGDDPSYAKNTKCAGGPFLAGAIDWGEEIWCNRQGRYTTLVANYQSESAPYSMGICSVGIFGTQYARSVAAPDRVTVAYEGVHEFSIAKITATFEIGNVLDIRLRKVDSQSLSWVTFIEQAGSHTIKLNPGKTAPGVYILQFESYDNNSTPKTALRTDTINIEISQPIC